MSMDDETDSRYTTGDIAKLTGVSVRTVQYYDAKGLLIPNEISDGGRRLYGTADGILAVGYRRAEATS